MSIIDGGITVANWQGLQYSGEYSGDFSHTYTNTYVDASSNKDWSTTWISIDNNAELNEIKRVLKFLFFAIFEGKGEITIKEYEEIKKIVYNFEEKEEEESHINKELFEF